MASLFKLKLCEPRGRRARALFKNDHKMEAMLRHTVHSWLNRKTNERTNHFRYVVNMAAPGAGPPTRLVQYVVVRSDLVHKLSWPLGAVITQACHAATAAIHLHYGDSDTQQYLAELDSMHKVVLGVRGRVAPHSIEIVVDLLLAGYSHTLITPIRAVVNL